METDPARADELAARALSAHEELTAAFERAREDGDCDQITLALVTLRDVGAALRGFKNSTRELAAAYRDGRRSLKLECASCVIPRSRPSHLVPVPGSRSFTA